MQLKPGTPLQGGKYRIERVLGQGGFGITYLAEHTMLETKLAIKEFFPNNFCSRENDLQNLNSLDTNTQLIEKLRQKFIKEARNVAKLHHPNIVRVSDIFEENNTAYYVMDFIEGESLSEIIRRDGKISQQDAIGLILKVGEAIAYIHQTKINHLDIKPANIMIQTIDNRPILIDFGMAKQYDNLGDQTSTTPVGVSHGFAPPEQYKNGGVSNFSPQTDIYSLGATLYTMISGVNPPDSLSLIETDLAFDDSFSDSIKPIILKAMSVMKAQRYQSVDEFIYELRNIGSGTEEDTQLVLSSRDNTSMHTEDKFWKEESEKYIIFHIENVEFKMIKVAGGDLALDKGGFWGKKTEYIKMESYLIGETPVTQELWKKVMGKNPSVFDGKDHPVENVSYESCCFFIQKLNRLTGCKFKIPSSYEWDYAARGGNQSNNYLYAGSNLVDTVAWHSGNSDHSTHPVKLKKPNELGIYDMSGNVWEMTNEIGDGACRKCCGGSWFNYSSCCKISFSTWLNPNAAGEYCGLRLVLTK